MIVYTLAYLATKDGISRVEVSASIAEIVQPLHEKNRRRIMEHVLSSGYLIVDEVTLLDIHGNPSAILRKHHV